MKKKLLITSSAIVLALGLAGCSNHATTSAKNSQEYAPVSKTTLVRANGSSPATIDYAKMQTNVANNIGYDIYEGLTVFNQSNEPVPGVAKSWKMSKDGLTYTFYLRHDAKFSNGAPVTAKDFVYGMQRAVNPETASATAYELGAIKNANAIMAGKMPVDKLGIEAINPYEIKIQLAHPQSFFLSVMTTPLASPVYIPGVEKYGEAFFTAKHLVSNGAYMMKDWIVNGNLTVTKNPYYWNAKSVHIKNVEFLPIVSSDASYRDFLSGKVDFTMYVPVANLKGIEKKLGSQVKQTPYLDLEYVNFNFTKAPFKNKVKLREAFSLVVNRKELAKYVFKSGKPAYSLFPRVIDNGVYKNVRYKWKNWSMEKRIALAKKLYKESGYSKENPLKVEYAYNTSAKNKSVVLAVSNMIHEALGVDFSLSNEQFKVFLGVRQSQSYGGLARNGWIANFNAMHSFAILYVGHNPQNDSGNINPKYDMLVKEAAAQTNPSKAVTDYTKAMNIMLNDYPVIALNVGEVQHLVKPYVTGYHPKNNHLDVVYDKWLSFKYAPKKIG